MSPLGEKRKKEKIRFYPPRYGEGDPLGGGVNIVMGRYADTKRKGYFISSINR
ncbi:hypothetical protein GW750_00595 [bacterium]|nr:hypothetical protein [bacterium]